MIIVGENPASQVYVRNKVKAAAYTGMDSRLIELDAGISERELLDRIAELCNIGTLWAFFMVSLTVIILRKTQPELLRTFRVPLVPFIPVLSMALCAFLASQLDHITWIVFVLWTCCGMVIYFAYGRKHSRLGR